MCAWTLNPEYFGAKVDIYSLMETAFARGTYTSLKQARASRRYREYLRESADEPAPELSATALMLGESLIDAGWRALPRNLRSLAQAWSGRSAEGQLVLLEMFFQQVHAAQRSYPEADEKRYRRQNVVSNLPPEHGVLGEGPVRPCCGGLGTLLMAFAKHTGASHYYAHVLFTVDKALMEAYLSLVLQVRTQLNKAFPAMAAAGELRFLDNLIRDTRTNLSRINFYNFHPCLVIKLSDGRWVLVDPNINVRGFIEPKHWDIEAATRAMAHAAPGKIANLRSYAAIDRLSKSWADEWDALRRFLTATGFIMREESGLARLFNVAGLQPALVQEDPWMWLPLTDRFTRQDLVGYGLFENRKVRSYSKVKAALERVEADPHFAGLTSERVALRPIRRWLEFTWDQLLEVRSTTPHTGLELSRPEMGVAVTVLANLRMHLGPNPKKLGGALALLSSCQLAWYNSRWDIGNRLVVPEEVARLQEIRAQAWRSLPRYGVHPYVAAALAAADATEGIVS